MLEIRPPESCISDEILIPIYITIFSSTNNGINTSN